MKGVNDYFESADHRLADDVRSELSRLGMMDAAVEQGTSTGRASSLASELYGSADDENSGFGVQWMPQDLFDADTRHLAYAIVRAVYHLKPTRNPLMAAVYRMLWRLADQGVETTMEAVTIGLLLGAACPRGANRNARARPREGGRRPLCSLAQGAESSDRRVGGVATR
jgi:hypothetical protein